MGFWPFGGGKRQRVVASDENGRETLLRRTPSDGLRQQGNYGEEKQEAESTMSKTRREDDNSRRLSKPRAQNSKTGLYAQQSRSQTETNRGFGDVRRTSGSNNEFNEKEMYQQNPMSQSSLQPENFTVVQAPPTLYAKRHDNDSQLSRRKSSKRKAEHFAREREIRAMTSSPIPIPKRPATIYSSGPLERDSQHFHGPLNRRLERPMSEISLPMAGSLPNVAITNQNSFKIGMLAALSPRPTVRYDANPKHAQGKQPLRPNMAIRQAIAEDDLSDKKRIDELADDLDAGGLRELMERDRRRRERKKEADKAKLQRKLQRRAERQREEDARRARTEAFVQASPTTPLQPQGLGIESSRGLQESSSRREKDDNDDQDPFRDQGPAAIPASGSIRNPFEDERDMDIMQDPQDSEDDLPTTGAIPIPVKSPARRIAQEQLAPTEKASHSTLSPPVSPVARAVDRSSLSQGSLLNREVTLDNQESVSLERRGSEHSSQRLSSWTTFFRRGTRRKFTGPSQGRTTPSEFSNTSRESFSRKQPPTVAPRTFRRSDSATPQRTLSRFREDLPELPISPPDSRVQSPDTTMPLSGSLPTTDHGQRATPSFSGVSSQRDSSGLNIQDSLDRTVPNRSTDLDMPLSAATGMMLSQSLASVDSEGSWLSGKPPKRLSGPFSHSVKPSQSSITRQMPGAFEQDVDDDVTNDEFLTQLDTDVQDPGLPDPQSPIKNRASSTILDSMQEATRTEDVPDVPPLPVTSEQSGEQPLQGIGKQPTVYQQASQSKSTEESRNKFVTADQDSSSSGEDDNDHSSESPDIEVNESPLLRAKSVEYKGHLRHVSAGSAKILDIRRSSVHSDLSRPATSAARKSDLALYQENESSSTPRL